MESEKAPVAWDSPLPYPSAPSNTAVTLTEPPPYNQAPPPYTVTAETHVYHTSTTEGGPVAIPPYPAGPQDNQFVHPYPPAATNEFVQPPPVTQIGPAHNHLHNTILQPGPTKVVHTTSHGRRTQKSFVTDLETGQQYIVKEKTSRNGRRHKAVIKELGGATTVVKETPKKTVVKQRNH